MGRRRKPKTENNGTQIETQTNTAPETLSESTDSGSTGNAAIAGPAESETGPDNAGSSPTEAYKASLSEFDSIIDKAKSDAQNISPTKVVESEKRGRKSKAEVAQEKVKVPGRLFALATDRLLANTICIVDSFTNKQPETIIPAKWLFADDKDLDEIAPIASSAAAELGIEEYPSVVFFGLIISNQMSRFAELKALIRQEKKKNPDFDIADIKKPGS